MKKDILVPFDGSQNAIEALNWAIVLATALDEKITVLNVQPSFHTVHTKMFFGEQHIREYQEQLFHAAVAPAEELLKATSVRYSIKLRIGDAKEQICAEAKGNCEEEHCVNSGSRMIIMGSRGMNPIMGGVLGSVSYGVVNGAPCPVTIVPHV